MLGHGSSLHLHIISPPPPPTLRSKKHTSTVGCWLLFSFGSNHVHRSDSMMVCIAAICLFASCVHRLQAAPLCVLRVFPLSPYAIRTPSAPLDNLSGCGTGRCCRTFPATRRRSAASQRSCGVAWRSRQRTDRGWTSCCPACSRWTRRCSPRRHCPERRHRQQRRRRRWRLEYGSNEPIARSSSRVKRWHPSLVAGKRKRFGFD